MSIKYIKKMPTAKEIIEEMPLSNHIKDIKKSRDIEIRKVFENESDKFLLIIGPCSADNEDSVCEYI
ncbi:MAG TPA: 3-deoxy-7-phosphoheptulonate synthase, partial [Clostridium sp.]